MSYSEGGYRAAVKDRDAAKGQLKASGGPCSHLSLSTGETSSLVGLGSAGYFGERDCFWKFCWYLYPIPALEHSWLSACKCTYTTKPGTVYGTRDKYLPFFHGHTLMEWFKCLYVLRTDLHVGLGFFPFGHFTHAETGIRIHYALCVGAADMPRRCYAYGAALFSPRRPVCDVRPPSRFFHFNIPNPSFSVHGLVQDLLYSSNHDYSMTVLDGGRK